MKLWKYTPDSDHFQTLALIDQSRGSSLVGDENYRYGKPLPEPLPTISVAYETDLKELSPSQRRLARQGKLPKGDFPSLYGTEVIFSQRALEVLEPLVQGSVQIIPLHCEEDQLYLIHITTVVDCLDRKRSEIKWLSGHEGEIVFQIRRNVFHGEGLIEKAIFKIPELFSSTFVSDRFKSIVEEHELQGLRWEPLP
jgi:hypothetical protein